MSMNKVFQDAFRLKMPRCRRFNPPLLRIYICVDRCSFTAEPCRTRDFGAIEFYKYNYVKRHGTTE